MRTLLISLLLIGCTRELKITPGDPNLKVADDYEIVESHNECDGLDAGCVVVTSVVPR